MVLSWGKPTVEFGVTAADGSAATEWSVMPEIKEDTSKLEVTEGELVVATEEGGDVVDARRKANKYKFSCDVFVKKGDTRPIPDVNGIIANNYSVRLTPEDPECEGFILDKTNVTVSESWTAADGKIIRYTFDGIKPKDGIINKPYTKGATA